MRIERNMQMTDSPNRETAKIYQFPTKARARKAGHGANVKEIADLRSPRYAYADFGNGWYHDAAICEADQHRR